MMAGLFFIGYIQWSINNQLAKFFRDLKDKNYQSNAVRFMIIFYQLLFFNFILCWIIGPLFENYKRYDLISTRLSHLNSQIFQLFQTRAFYFLADIGFENRFITIIPTEQSLPLIKSRTKLLTDLNNSYSTDNSTQS